MLKKIGKSEKIIICAHSFSAIRYTETKNGYYKSTVFPNEKFTDGKYSFVKEHYLYDYKFTFTPARNVR